MKNQVFIIIGHEKKSSITMVCIYIYIYIKPHHSLTFCQTHFSMGSMLSVKRSLGIFILKLKLKIKKLGRIKVGVNIYNILFKKKNGFHV